MLPDHGKQNEQNHNGFESMMNHFVGSVDLTGAELEFAGLRLNVTSGKLGHFNSKSRQVSGCLAILSNVKPSLLSSVVKINWREQQFMVMMLSIQELNQGGELKLKFVARWIAPDHSLFV
jgi:hypothetical protein